MRPSSQCHGRWGLTASLAEVPLVDGQSDIQSQVKLVFGQECGYAAHYRFVEAARGHERMQSHVQLLLASSMLFFSFRRFRRVYSLLLIFYSLCLHFSRVLCWLPFV